MKFLSKLKHVEAAKRARELSSGDLDKLIDEMAALGLECPFFDAACDEFYARKHGFEHA